MAEQQNQYDFILDPQVQKNNRAIAIPQSGTRKIVLMVGFVAAVALLAIGAILFFTSLNKPSDKDLIAVQAQQVELTRVIELGLKDATDQTLRNRLATLQATVATDEKAVADLLDKRNVKVTKVELAAAKDTDTDTALEKAKGDGSINRVVTDTIDSLSGDYYKKLKTALADASSKTEKELLETAITNLELTAKN